MSDNTEKVLRDMAKSLEEDPRDLAIRDMAEALTKVCRDMQDMRVQSRGYRTAIYMLTKHAAQIKRAEGE